MKSHDFYSYNSLIINRSLVGDGFKLDDERSEIEALKVDAVKILFLVQVKVGETW